MVRKELISRVAALLREKDIRKPVSIPKQVFHISDENGNHKDFIAPETDKSVLYNVNDIEAIVDACIYVIKDALKRGEEIAIYGFGKLCLRYAKEHTVRNVLDGEPAKVEGHYIPKFTVGNELRRCAQIYEQSLKDKELSNPFPIQPDMDD